MELRRAKYFGLGFLSAFLVAVTAGFLFVLAYRSQGLHLRFDPIRLKSNGATESVGAWGRLEALELPLANPRGSLVDRAERLQPPRWFFEHASEAMVVRFLKSSALSRPQRRALLNPANWNVTSNGCLIIPPEPLIWFLSGASRQRIYSVLASSRSNYAQCFPFRFPIEGFEEAFANSGLRAGQMQRIRRLAYTNAGDVCIADLPALQKALTPRDFNRLAEVLYRIPAYQLRLRVTPDSDTDVLVKYWGKGGREKLVEPLLDSLAHVPEGASINVSYFLPPFARLRLYTFPDSWDDPTVSTQDCVFTAMNFFNATPDTNLLDGNYTRKLLEAHYAPVGGSPTFGDLVYLMDPRGAALHMCVYIAGDFVFTKNGMNLAMPWVLMKLSDVVTMYYPPDKSGKIIFLRRKDFG